MSNQNNPETRLIQPLLGNNHRETMNKVGGVLAFIARSMESPPDPNRRTAFSLDRYNETELQGLIAICRVLSNALSYEPPPMDTFG